MQNLDCMHAELVASVCMSHSRDWACYGQCRSLGLGWCGYRLEITEITEICEEIGPPGTIPHQQIGTWLTLLLPRGHRSAVTEFQAKIDMMRFQKGDTRPLPKAVHG